MMTDQNEGNALVELPAPPETKFYVDANGCYLGGYGGVEPPEDAIEVPAAPARATDIWTGGAWVPAPVAPVPAIPMLNLNLVLIEDEHLQTVENIIATMPGAEGQRARAYWSKALTARRDNELVNLLWPQLYASEAEFDSAWARAAALDP